MPPQHSWRIRSLNDIAERWIRSRISHRKRALEDHAANPTEVCSAIPNLRLRPPPAPSGASSSRGRIEAAAQARASRDIVDLADSLKGDDQPGRKKPRVAGLDSGRKAGTFLPTPAPIRVDDARTPIMDRVGKLRAEIGGGAALRPERPVPPYQPAPQLDAGRITASPLAERAHRNSDVKDLTLDRANKKPQEMRATDLCAIEHRSH